jgi:hypothetical protein
MAPTAVARRGKHKHGITPVGMLFYDERGNEDILPPPQ